MDNLQRFLNGRDGMSYLVPVSSDVPKEQMSDDDFHEMLKSQQLSASESVRLIDEGLAELPGAEFYRIRTKSEGTKGQMCTCVYNRRDSYAVHCQTPRNFFSSFLP